MRVNTLIMECYYHYYFITVTILPNELVILIVYGVHKNPPLYVPQLNISLATEGMLLEVCVLEVRVHIEP